MTQNKDWMLVYPKGHGDPFQKCTRLYLYLNLKRWTRKKLTAEGKSLEKIHGLGLRLLRLWFNTLISL
jgi:hypothetical protein